MSGLLELLAEELSLYQESNNPTMKSEDELDSGPSKPEDENAVSTDVAPVVVERTDEMDISEDERMDESGIEMPFDSVRPEERMGDGNDINGMQQQTLQLEPEQRPKQQQDTKKPAKKLSTKLLALSRKKSWARSNSGKVQDSKNEMEAAIEDSMREEVSEEDTASMETFETVSVQSANPPHLKTLVVDEEKEMEKEVDELIRNILVGFDSEEIERELNDHQSIAYSMGDVAKNAECFLASWVDRMDILGVCDGCRPKCGARYGYDYPDGVSINSVQSVCSGTEKGPATIKSTESNDTKSILLNDAKEIVDGSESPTVVSNEDFSIDDESLASEYDDFNKAMMMVKNRAARRRISEAMLLEKIQGEQKRRKSQGLTPTMIEI